MKRNTFKLPNRLVWDVRLSPSARKVGAVLYGHRNALGFCCKSLEALGTLSGCCITTVRKATEELADAGYISMTQTYRYLPQKGRRVYGRKVYQVNLSFQGGYTLIPRDMLNLAQRDGLTASTVLVCLALCVEAGNSRRAYPSISRIGRMVGIARSTVCRALLQIKALPEILVLRCRKRNGSFAASSYHLTTVLAPNQAVAANESVPTIQQGAAGWRIQSILHNFILRVRRGLRNLFLGQRVDRKLTNLVKT